MSKAKKFVIIKTILNAVYQHGIVSFTDLEDFLFNSKFNITDISNTILDLGDNLLDIDNNDDITLTNKGRVILELP